MIEALRFDTTDQALFHSLPESGMGYHFFKYQKPEGKNVSIEEQEFVVISNSEIIIHCARDFPVSVGWNKSELNMTNIERDDLNEIKAAIKGYSKELKFKQKYEDSPIITIGSPSTLPPPYTYLTRQGDEFRRLSAFRRDNRVLADGSLRKGSYGTTILDLAAATSGVSAVGRYALPNRLAACYVFQIIPPPGTKVLFGTVTPNFGLCGGGVEVYFPEGCAEGSVRLMGTIPEF